MIELLLNSDFTDESLLDLVARQTPLLDLFDSDGDAKRLVLGFLDLTVRSFTQVARFAGFKLQVPHGDATHNLLKLLLLRRESSLVHCIFDEGSLRLYPIDLSQEHGVSGFWELTRTFKLMSCKPIDLTASLAAVLLDTLDALGAAVARDELLVELFAFPVVLVWVVDADLILEPHLLQRTLFISALAWVDHLVVRRFGYWFVVHSAHICHHH